MTEERLIAEMTALRAKLAVTRRRELLWRGFVLVVVACLAYLLNEQAQTTDDILDTRKTGRAATCQVFQAQTDALARAAGASAEDLKGYVDDLNRNLGVIDCVLQVNVP